MLSSAISEYFYTGNNSTVTSYPVSFLYLDADHVKVQRIDAGTGTVTVAAGVATFSSAQSTLEVGSHVRISGTTYTIDTRTSDTVFTFTTRPTIASSSFHLPDDATSLVSGSTYTLTGVSGSASITTNPAVAATALLRIYREVPLTQLTELPSTGPVPTESIEDALDLLTMALQQINTALLNSGVIVPEGGLSTTDTTFFANDAARAAAVPSRLYQLGLQIDTKTLYYGSALTAGGWTQTTFKVRVLTDPSTDTPLYTGEIATFKGATTFNKYAPAIYKGTATSAGSWELCIPNRIYGCFNARPWGHNEELKIYDSRVLGVSGMYRWVDQVVIHPDVMGYGDLQLRLIAKGAQTADRSFFSTTFTSTAYNAITDINDTMIDPGFGAAGGAVVIGPTDRIYAEIQAVGQEQVLDVTAGSSTLTGADLTLVGTGSGLDASPITDSGLYGVVVHVRGDGTVIRSHPATMTSASAGYFLSGRIFARGLTGTWAGQTSTINSITATDTSLLRVGDRVIGPTCHPECRILTISSTSFTISHPLYAGTTLVTVINEDRPPVMHFTVISEPDGETVIAVPDTTLVNVGDRVLGTNIPAEAYVASKTSTTFTLSSAISGGAITEITVAPPMRRATITGGTYVIAVNHATGLKVGMKVEGVGVPASTFITEINGTNITVNNLLSLDSSGASTDLVEFTREEIQLTGGTTADSVTFALDYNVSTTPIDLTYDLFMEAIGEELQAGTVITDASGTSLTLSRQARITDATTTIRLRKLRRWKGLSVAIAGRHFAGTT